MKKSLLSIVAVLFAFAASAQVIYDVERETWSDDPVVRINSGGRYHDGMTIRTGGYTFSFETARQSRSKRGRYEGRIGSFEIGFNGFRELSDAYAAYPEGEQGFMDIRMGKSIHFTYNIWTFATRFTRNNVLGITGAIGFTANNYRFETTSHYVLTGKMLHPVDAGHYLKKSKLNTFAIHFPLALEVNPTRNFFFSVGGWVDLVTGSHMKWKAPKGKLKRMGVQNFLQAGATVRIGFKNAYVFGSYNFVELFKEGRGPVFNPYTFGMGFGI